jgi:hypothetical protein
MRWEAETAPGVEWRRKNARLPKFPSWLCLFFLKERNEMFVFCNEKGTATKKLLYVSIKYAQ